MTNDHSDNLSTSEKAKQLKRYKNNVTWRLWALGHVESNAECESSKPEFKALKSWGVKHPQDFLLLCSESKWAKDHFAYARQLADIALISVVIAGVSISSSY